VGNEDFPRHVNEQELASNKRPPAKKGFATKASLPRRRKPSFRNIRKVFQAAKRARRCSSCATHQLKKTFWFQALMHFSAYLVIAALVLMGLQLAYAFYQLATFVL